MQIHELNNYSGNLDSGAFVAVDNGMDTGKVSTANLMAGVENEIAQLGVILNGRIDNIIAGGDAPSAAEIVDARYGDDNITYPSLGDAIRDQISDVKGEINEIVTSMGAYIPIQKWDHAMDLTTGLPYALTNFVCTAPIFVNKGDTLTVKGYTSTGEINPRARICYYKGNTYIGQSALYYETMVDGVITINVNLDCSCIRLSLMAWQSATITLAVNNSGDLPFKYHKQYLESGTDITNVLNYSDIIELPEGVFTVKQTESLANKRITGQGIEKTILKAVASASMPMISVVSATDFCLENLTLTHSDSASDIISSSDGYVGLDITDSTNVFINRVLFRGWGNTCLKIHQNIFKDFKIANCIFEYSYIGLWLDTRAEFIQVDNCSMYKCFVGCINGGGNNLFSNCMFNFNNQGFALNTGANDGHGSCVGCQFNHNTRYPILAQDLVNGFIFSGCQAFYGTINLINSFGIVMDACELGDIRFDDHGSGFLWLHDCLFLSNVIKTALTSSANVVENNRNIDGTLAN